jgi:uncharacterized protein (DUF305 family)
VVAARPLIAGAAGAVLLLGGCGIGGGTVPPGPATTTAVSPRFNVADVTFVRALVPQHLVGVEIARIGAQRAARPEIRMLAGAIVATQTDEAARLTGWLSAWGQPAPPAATTASGKPAATTGKPAARPTGKPGAGGAGADPAIAALRTMPAAGFDRAFLDLMIAQQDAAVKLARTETGAGTNPNALAFARQVDESRTAEIAQMRNYLA